MIYCCMPGNRQLFHWISIVFKESVTFTTVVGAVTAIVGTSVLFA